MLIASIVGELLLLLFFILLLMALVRTRRAEARIRTRAYLQWESAGRPSDSDTLFWGQAEQEVVGQLDPISSRFWWTRLRAPRVVRQTRAALQRRGMPTDRSEFAAFVRHWAYTYPLIAFCAVVIVVNLFDRQFISEYPRAREHHFLCASTVGLAACPGAPGPILAACTLCPGRMLSGSPKSVVAWFKWAHTPRDTMAATREMTARFVVEIADFAAIIMALIAVTGCLYRIWQLWSDVDWIRKAILVELAALTAYVTHLLWFAPGQPFEDTLPNELIARAMELMDRSGPGDLDSGIQVLVILVLLPLLGVTSGFIVTKNVTSGEDVKRQLRELTILLVLTAVVVVLFMSTVGAPLLWVAALLPQGKDSEGALVQQLALAMSLNFGAFFTLLLAALHVPAAWAVISKHDTDRPVTLAEHYLSLATILSPIVAGISLTKLVSFVFG